MFVKKKLVLFSFMVCFVLLLCGCGSKKAITTRDFKNITEQSGFSTMDVKDQFDSNVIVEGTLAYTDDYKLEFYVLDSSDSAKSMFEHNKSIFEGKKSGISSYVSTDLANYNTYMLQSGGYYMYLSRIDNTLLYVNVLDSYKDIIKEVVKDLGY